MPDTAGRRGVAANFVCTTKACCSLLKHDIDVLLDANVLFQIYSAENGAALYCGSNMPLQAEMTRIADGSGDHDLRRLMT